MGRRGAGGVGRRMAQRVFVKTFFVRGKIGGDGSDLGKVRVGEFLTGEIRTRSETLRALPAARRRCHFERGDDNRALAHLAENGAEIGVGLFL